MSEATVSVRFPNVRIHESSYVDDPVQIGEGTSIWHFCHILGEVRIGRNCSIGQNVMIGPRVVVGNNCKIQNNVSLYEGVTLEDDVFCGPSCVFTNVINPRSAVSRKHEFRPTLVQARRYHRRKCNDRLRATRGKLCVRRRRRGGDEGRAGFRA